MLYKPGVCNIGKNEIKKRYTLAAIGFVIAAAVFLTFHFYAISVQWTFLIVIPLFVSFEGLYQGKFHFCAGLGMSGKYDFRGTRNEHGVVRDAKQHRRDIVMSMKINAYSIWSAVVTTIILVFVYALVA